MPGNLVAAHVWEQYERIDRLRAWRFVVFLVNGVFYGGLGVIVVVVPWWNRLRGRAGRRVGVVGLLASSVIVLAFFLSLRWGYGYAPGWSIEISPGMPVNSVACSDGAFLLMLGGASQGGQGQSSPGYRHVTRARKTQRNAPESRAPTLSARLWILLLGRSGTCGCWSSGRDGLPARTAPRQKAKAEPPHRALHRSFANT